MLQVINGNLKKVNAHSMFDFFYFPAYLPWPVFF